MVWWSAGVRRWPPARPSGMAALALPRQSPPLPAPDHSGRRQSLRRGRLRGGATELDSVSPHVTHRWPSEQDWQAAQDIGRSPDHAPRRLCDQPGAAASGSEEVFGWIKSSAGRLPRSRIAWSRAGRCRIHHGAGRLQPDPPAPGCWRRQHERAGQVAHRREGRLPGRLPRPGRASLHSPSASAPAES